MWTGVEEAGGKEGKGLSGGKNNEKRERKGRRDRRLSEVK